MKESLWDVYTAKNEYASIFKDKFNRVLSYSINAENISKPIVSEYLFNNGFKPNYPEGKKFAVALTHDIDVLYINKNFKKCIRNSFKGIIEKNNKLFYHSVKSIIKKEIWDEFHIKNLLKLNSKYNAKSSYYFLAVERDNTAHNYCIKDIKALLDIIEDHDNEVGLHGSYLAYNNTTQIQKEKKRLENVFNEKIIGYRNHNLNFDIESSWSILEQAGFVYDTTYGLVDRVGFRNGMCYPFQPFNLKSNKFHNIVEFPLHVMDVSLFKYMNLSYKGAYQVFRNLVSEVESCNGVFTFLWHNTNMHGDMVLFYEECLKYLKEKNAWISSVKNIYEWWNANDYFSKIHDILRFLIINTKKLS